MSRFSFVHASDLHLDSPFVGVTARAPEVANLLYRATFVAFDNVVRLCLERQVDFLLVAGDVYDGADRSLRAQLHFRDGLKRLADRGIRAFVVHGNHDPLEGWSSAIEWPRGVHVFQHQVETLPVERDGALVAFVSGMSYPRRQEPRNLALLFNGRPGPTLVGEAPFHIGLLHTNVGQNPEHGAYAPCELSDLVDRGIDYWALGHIHRRQTLCESPHVVYPGNTQGRNIQETGTRGCTLVEVDGRSVETEFVAVDAVRWQQVGVDIAGITTVDALEVALNQAVEGAIEVSDYRPSICRVGLTGRGSLFRELLRPDHAAQLLERLRQRYAEARPFVWVEQIDLDCLPEFDVEQRRKSQDLGGELLRAGATWREANLREALWPAVEPLYGHRRLATLLEAPSERDLERLLTDAELLCLDRLDGAQ